MPYRFVSFIGIFALICVAWLMSENRSRLNYRVISFGILIQFAFAAFIFIFPPGIKLFLLLNDAVSVIMNSASAGARFVFGPLALPP